jgi:hypothetical protein
VCANDDANDANQKGRRKTIWGVSVCRDVGNGDACHNGDGALNCWFCC